MVGPDPTQSEPGRWDDARARARSYASSAQTYWVSRPSFLQRVLLGAAGLVLLGLLVIVLGAALLVGSVFALVFFLALTVRRAVDALLGRSPARTAGDTLRRNVRVVRSEQR